MRLTLCGSAKYESRFHEWNEKLTMSGHVVYSLAIYPSSKGGNKDWYDQKTKIILDQIHLCKILNSDGVVVLNEDDDGYYGESTTNEIQFARINDKSIYWTKPHMVNMRFGDAWAGVLLNGPS